MKSCATFWGGLIGAALVLSAGSAARAAVSLAVSPPAITNDYSGKITLTITGLSPAQQVQVKRFYDLSGNGVIGGRDFVVQSFKVTDGQVSEIGGVRNLNVPGDEDGLTNGQIVTRLDYPGLGGPASAVTGNFIFRLEDQSGNTLATQVFSVAQQSQPQGVRGLLLSPASVPITNSPVALIDPSGAKNAIAALTDTNGFFQFYAPTGSYALASINSGFVSDENAGAVTVPAGQWVTNNLTLMAGAATLAGTLTDATSGKAVGAIFVNGEATNNLFSGAFTDTNGFFSFPVNASQWKVKPDAAGLALKSYLLPQNAPSVTISNTSFTNYSLPLPKAVALIYGTVRDTLSNAVSGILLTAGDSGNLYESIGLSETNGAYTLGVVADNWNAGPDSAAVAAAGYSSGSSTNLTLIGGQALPADFVLQGVTAHLRGQVKDDLGNAITNIEIVVQTVPLQGNGNNALYPTTDGNGNFEVGVYGGTWNLALECVSAQNRGYVDISGLNETVVDGVDQNGLVLTFPRATGLITGRVTDPVGNPIAGVTLDASQPINAGSAYIPGCVTTDLNGVYQIQVLSGAWTVTVRNDDLNALGYNAIASTNVTMVAGAATANFTAPVTLTAPRFKAGGFSQATGAFFTVSGPVAHTNTLQYSTNLVNWLTLTNALLTNAIWQVFDPAATTQNHRFYRAVAAP